MQAVLIIQKILLKIINSIPSDAKVAPTAEEDNLHKLKAVYTSCMDTVSRSKQMCIQLADYAGYPQRPRIEAIRAPRQASTGYLRTF
jgi:hypothetical protein